MKKLFRVVVCVASVLALYAPQTMAQTKFRMRKKVCDIMDSTCATWVAQQTGTGETPGGTSFASISISGNASAMDVDGGGNASGTETTGSTVSFTIRNDGTEPTGAMSISVGGTNATNFEISPDGPNTCSGSLAVGASCIISVRPVASENGTYSGTLIIAGAPGGALSLPLSGNASDFVVDGLEPGLYCWGHNGFGVLGNGTASSASTAVAVLNMSSGVTSFAPASYHTCSLKDGAIYCWGNDGYGALGNGAGDSSFVPMEVTNMTSGGTQVVAGTYYGCGLKDGGAYCWGYNTYGQLGDGTNTSREIPVPVSGMSSNVSALAANYAHTCALQNGILYCWGYNNAGQLGTGNSINQNTPVVVSGMETGVTHFSVGVDHSCAIKADALYCWGSNVYAQLGDGSTTAHRTPALVSGMSSGVTAVAAGAQNTCAIKDDVIYCWGRNHYGQLGDGSTITRSTPVVVTDMTANIDDVSPFGDHTCAIRNGAAYCWGENTSHQLGDGTITNSSTPVAVVGMDTGITAVKSATNHSCALKSGGGSSGSTGAEIGSGSVTGNPLAMDVAGAGSLVGNWEEGSNVAFTITNTGDETSGALSVDIAGANPLNFEISPTGTNTCAGNTLAAGASCTVTVRPLADDNGVYTAILIVSGTPGGTLTANLSGTASGFLDEPALSLSVNSAVLDISGGVSPGDYTTFTVSNCMDCATTSAIVVGVDNTTNFELGTNTCTTLAAGASCTIDVRPLAADNGTYNGTLTVEAASGGTVTVALSGTASGFGGAGDLLCWGDNGYGQLGDGTTTDRYAPVAVSGMGSSVVTLSTAGERHTCALKDGAFYCWGDNGRGQLGDGTTADHYVPAAVSGMGSSDITASSGGGYHACVIKDEALYCWGYNGYGQLGDGTTTDRYAPVAVSGMDSGVTNVATGGSHTCAIKNGTLYCWGYDFNGELGDGLSGLDVYRTTPLVVTGMNSGVTAVAADIYHTCAVQNGALYCWGHNAYGRLGDGTSGNTRTTPVAVVGMDSGVTTVAEGYWHTCAIKNGAVYCWGRNSDGQLGDGTTTNHLTPVAVLGMGSGITVLASGYEHNCSIKEGFLYCWGNNNVGQLGDGTLTDRYVPAAVSGMDSGVSSFATGYSHTCAVPN
ncbi:MAG: hypothetical protein A2018_07320 [Alphaproteobacteria bacterium GWF2_58_20]|nr:MAG: hypothetical protein A2018_07320 [Alphaproteobacteria bacterium GWF2_58_20]